MKTTRTVIAAVVFTALLAAAKEAPKPKTSNYGAVSAGAASSHSDQKQKEKAKHDKKKAKKAEPTMQPDDPRKSPWAEPRDWNYISNYF